MENNIAQQNLVTYGWNQYWEDVIHSRQINIAGLELGRVVAQFSKQYRLITQLGETTHRELFVLPNGAIMIDTPGMRELQLWDTESGWHTTFADIEKLALTCRYRDCQHQSESGCAVKQAIEVNELDSHRYANYLKTKKELNYLARKEQTVNKQLRKNNKKYK